MAAQRDMKKPRPCDGGFFVITDFENIVVLLLEKQFKRTTDFGFVRFDASAELNLDACAMEVLAVVFCLEIDVACEIVREEAEGQFIGDEASRIVDMLFVEICERAFTVCNCQP